MTWPEERHTVTWGDTAECPAVGDGEEARVRLLRIVLPQPLTMTLRGAVAKKTGTPVVQVSWQIRVGIGRVTIPLTHQSQVQDELEPDEWRMVSGANILQIQLPAESIELLARIRPQGGALQAGDVRLAAWMAPAGVLVWPQGEHD